MVYGIIDLLGFIGLPRVAAVALAILLYEQKGLTLSELVRRTGYAKSHLSTYLKTLAANGLVECIYSGRRVVYRARKQGVIKLLKNHLESLKHRIDYASKTLHDYELSTLLSGLSEKISQIIKDLEENHNV